MRTLLSMLTAMVLFVSPSGCVGTAAEPLDPPVEDDAASGGAPGALMDLERADAPRFSSDEELSALRLVNEASVAELTAAAGLRLSSTLAMRIVAARAGADGREGTVDDDPFNDLNELDAVPTVGARVLERARGYVRLHPLADLACEALSERPFPTALMISPEDGDAPVMNLIAEARRSILITIYQFDSAPIEDALAAAVLRGVDVRVLLDRAQPENGPLATALEARGIRARLTSERFRFTHQKTIVVDGEVALLYSGNLERRSLGSARNYGVIDRDFEDVRDLVTLFEADFLDREPTISCTRLVLSPINSRARVLELIDGARRTLEVEAMYVTDRAVEAAIVRAVRRGVRVRMLLNDPAFGIGDSSSAARAVAAAGGLVRRLPGVFIHAKVLFADGERFFVGSENYSSNSLDQNREAGLVLDSTGVDLSRARGRFEADWSAGVGFF